MFKRTQSAKHFRGSEQFRCGQSWPFVSSDQKVGTGSATGERRLGSILEDGPHRWQIPIASNMQFRTCIGKCILGAAVKVFRGSVPDFYPANLHLSCNKTPIFQLPRANHVSSARVTGFFSHTKVVLTLVTSMLRPRSFLSQSTFPNIHQTKRSLQYS